MLISNVLSVTNNDHVMAADCARAASGPGLYLAYSLWVATHAEPGWPAPEMLAIFLLSSRRVIRSSRYLESVFFAFVKFIMCLLVPEVKAVSCACVLHMQVLESNKKKRISRGLVRHPKACFRSAFDAGLEAPIRAASGCLNINSCEPILHDMFKLWRTHTVNTKRCKSRVFAYGTRGRGHALHLAVTSHRTQTSAGEHHAE
jgi:hypothetical protein